MRWQAAFRRRRARLAVALHLRHRAARSREGGYSRPDPRKDHPRISLAPARVRRRRRRALETARAAARQQFCSSEEVFEVGGSSFLRFEWPKIARAAQSKNTRLPI